MGLFRPLGGIRLATGLALCMLSALAVAVEPALINRANQQRMLAQRVVKAYSQIGLNVLPTAAMNQLTEALAGFDANLLALDSKITGDEAKRMLSELALAWQPLKAGAMSPISQTRALELSRASETVESAARRLVQVLQDQADVPANRLVNLAGRQRVLCQRIAKAFMLRSWGIDAAAVRDELDAAVNEFSGGLATLQAQSGNTPAIRQELDDIALQWEWLKAAIAAEGASSYRLIVAEATESILVSAERVTRMYEEAARR